MSVSTEKDPLTGATQPDRVSYALGALLGVNDFTDEQTYHRGRLARALSFLEGTGTVSGLQVEYRGPKGPDEQILVHPGMAVDRLGRIVEIPADACIRLDKWFAAEPPADLVEGFHAPSSGVIADVFLRFAACDRTLTPAFATGPFDATDFVSPARVRDAYQLDLVIRKEGNPPLPQDPWPDLAAEADPVKRRAALHAAIFASWNAPIHQRGGDGALVPLPEHVPNQDPTAMFLARVIVPAAAGNPPLRTADPVTIDNEQRRFIYPAGALARWLGV